MSTLGLTLVGLASSSVTFVAGWIAARHLVLRLPVDFYTHGNGGSAARRATRSALGLALVAVGVVLLFLPGPGLLLIVAGLALSELPGRERLLRWALGRPKLLHAANALRARHGIPPLSLVPNGSSSR